MGKRMIRGARSADDVEMGGFGNYVLPAPGAPEPVSGYIAVGGCGCGCGGSGKCGGSAMAGITDTLTSPAVLRVAEGGLAYLAFTKGRKAKGLMKALWYAAAAYGAYDVYKG